MAQIRDISKRTALYERLSKDDEQQGESNSILNQKQYLEEYAHKNGFVNIQHFTDDGYTGRNFNRPGFQEMLAEIENGKIGTVIVKDMSRFGRNYLQVGFYTEMMFPQKQVRFIAINNSVDSDKPQDNDFTPFLNIMNEWYAKDTSNKIKSIFLSRMNDGKRCSGSIPYGYNRLPGDKQTLVVDPVASKVVKHIFALAADGYNPPTIAKKLTEEEVLKLGRWIERLRAFHNGNPKIKVALTQTGIVMLEKIGMVWKLESRYPWPEWYLQCRLYYAANGDLLVPKMYKNEQYALGNWIGEQRKKYKKGTLKPEQVEALEKVGMVWELVDRDVWEKRYNDAYAYYNEHGDIDVPPNVLTAGNMYLRDWLIAQKSLYQESNCETDLDWERHDLLDDIGMDWEKQVGRKSYSYAYRAQRYYNEFGNLDVPEDYNDMMGGNLHEWVKRQWRLYHRPTTDKSDAYISKKKELENLGFDWSCEGRWDWDAKEATWLQNYNGIKAYVDANGSLPIGESSIPLTTSVNSEFWIAAQKAAIRNGMMNEDKQQMLASIGVVYGQFKRSDDWQENYNYVKAYYEQHKQLPVGVNSQQMSTGSQSGYWIGLQRKKLKDNTLPAEKVSLLKEIGIEYGQFENSWNANYNAVKAFFDEHHHLPVQDASILLPSGIQSRNWITNQKKFLKTGTAPEDRVKLLNEIGIVAEADAPKPSKSKSEKVKKAAQTGSKPSRKVSKNPAEEWQECYDFVKRCLEEGGTLPIGEKSTTMPNGVQTKSWIKQQRIALKESRLPADKVELLRAIGIVGNLMEQNWMRDYECIKAYVEEHHQLPVYKNSFELPDGGQSAQWIANRRTQMRNGTMPEERVKMLADIGIVYGSLADNWKESYNAIKAYLDEHGELPLKEASITLPTGSQSHWWIRNQTLMLHQGRQSEDKVKLLNEIGIV